MDCRCFKAPKFTLSKEQDAEIRTSTLFGRTIKEPQNQHAKYFNARNTSASNDPRMKEKNDLVFFISRSFPFYAFYGSVSQPDMRSPTVKNFFSSFRVVAQKEDSIEQMFEESKVVVGGDNFGRVVYLSFCFLVLFVGFGAPQALLTVLFPANGVGFNSLAILYFCFAFASLFAQLLSRFRIDPKWSMTVASLAYVFFVGAMLTQIDWVLYMASALEGIGAAGFWAFFLCFKTIFLNLVSALWVSEGLWVSRSRCNERGHNVFFVLFACSSIITSLLSGLVLRYLPPMTFVAIFTGVAGVGTLMLCFVAPVRNCYLRAFCIFINIFQGETSASN
jgi:hypothetical protein